MTKEERCGTRGEEDAEEEEPQELPEKIQRLRELVAGEDGLNVRTDDNFMLRYLRCCRYDPDVALDRMKTYYRLKYNYPNWFATCDAVSTLNEEISKGYYYFLPEKDREGKCIYVNQIGNIKASKSSMAQESQLHDLYTETVLDDETIQKRGLCVIIDLKNCSLKLLKWLTPGNLRIAVKKTETLPVKKIEFHVVNMSVFLNTALKVVLPFLSPNTKDNIHLHDSNWSRLHTMIDPERLPKTYGGSLESERIISVNKNSDALRGNLNLGYKKNPGALRLDS